LVKWKDQPIAEAIWMTDAMLQKLGSFVEDLMNAHEEFCPQESNARA